MLNYLKKVGINSTIYSLGDFLIMGSGIILIPFYTAYLPTSDYGIINYLLAINSFLLPFIALSIFQTIPLKYFDFIKNPERFKVFFSTIFYFVIAFSTTFLLVILLLEYKFHLLTSEKVVFYPLFFLSILTCFFTQFLQIPLRIFSCQEKAMKYSLFNFFNFIVGIGLLIFFIAYLKQGILGNVRALLIRDVVMAVIAILIVKKYLVFNFSSSLLKKALYLAAPLIPHSLSATALTLLDRIFLAKLDTLEVLGLYSLSYQISGVLPVIGGAIALSIYPIFFQLHKSAPDKESEVKKVSSRLMTLAVYLFIFLTLSLIVFAKEVIFILAANKEYYSAYRIIPILALGGFFYVLYYLAGIVVSYLKKTYILLICSLSSAALNLVLNILLIPRFSQLGAAIATAISYFLMFAIGYYLTNKFMPLPFDKKRLLGAFGFGVLLSLIAVLAINRLPLTISTIFAKIILLAVFPLMLIKLKFVELGEVINLIKTRLNKQKS